MDKERKIIIAFAAATVFLMLLTASILIARSLKGSGNETSAPQTSTSDRITDEITASINDTTAAPDSGTAVPESSTELPDTSEVSAVTSLVTEISTATQPPETLSPETSENKPETSVQPPETSMQPPETTSIPQETTSVSQSSYDANGVSLDEHTFVFSYTDDGKMTLLQNTGRIDDKIYPASLTKLVTALTVMEYAGNRLDDTVTVDDADLKLVSPGSSLACLEAGMQLSLAQCLECMLIPSGNDAAYVVARYVGGLIDPSAKSASAKVNAFVKKMNEWSVSNALLNSSWKNPDGFHAVGHYTSVSDMMIIVLRTVKNPVLKAIVSSGAKNVKLVSGAELPLKCTNLLLDPESKYYNPACTGIKTGYTANAGNCLVASFEKNGVTYFTGLFGIDDAYARFSRANSLFKTYS